jgi:hypothetical protein
LEVLPKKGRVSGHPIQGAGLNPHEDKGRVATLDPSALRRWAGLQKGMTVALPGFDAEPLLGEVQLRMEDRGWIRVGGTLAGGQGTFTLNTNFDDVSGAIFLPEVGRAYQIGSEVSGAVVMVERRLSSLVCWPGVAAAAAEGAAQAGAESAIPQINTRPGAKGLIYIDFDGEEVVDPAWNGGRAIVAGPSSLNADQIREVVARVAEDYAPFDMAISTIRSDYDSKPPGRRMRVIVTPTATAAPGAGGVAMVGSWSQAGRGFSSTVPAWVFNRSAKAVAEGVSHEVGHTLGLSHQGTVATATTAASEYYGGHGGPSGLATSWAPIMGVSYNRSLTQWSKGEYSGANNTEDALAIIAGPANGVGYRSESFAANTLSFSGDAFQLKGVLRSSTVPDVYQFETLGGVVGATALPAQFAYTNVDLELELQDAEGRTLAVSSPSDVLGASVSRRVSAGTYRWVVRSAGTGLPPEGGYTTGYSAYGSLGEYSLSGRVGNVVALPVFTSLPTATGVAGQPFRYSVQVSQSAVTVSAGSLPPGISFDPAAVVFQGTPEMAGRWLVTLSARNAGGTAAQRLEFIIREPATSISEILGAVSGLSTGPAESPWVSVSEVRADGQSGLVAASGLLTDGKSSRLQFTVPGQSVLSFWCRVSSESGHDVLQCRVNNVLAMDADTGRPVVLSGESGWVRRRIRLGFRGEQRVEISYSKDANVSSGRDRAWIYGVEVGAPPVFRTSSQFPRTLSVKPGETTFTLSLVADRAESYRWKKDGVVLEDGPSGSRTIFGATTSTLIVSGASGADSGNYTLEASNASGTVESRRALVSVAGLPEITMQPTAPVGLKLGDPLMLSAGVAGPPPVFCLWTRNGYPLQWRASPVYQVPRLRQSDLGVYKMYARNQWGVVESQEVVVRLGSGEGSAAR